LTGNKGQQTKSHAQNDHGRGGAGALKVLIMSHLKEKIKAASKRLKQKYLREKIISADAYTKIAK
jgi:hypothetical protein